MKNWAIFLLLLLPLKSFGFPEAPFDALKTILVNPTRANQDYDFEGIVKLSNCSGSIVKFAGQPDTTKALVLTNGHCVKKWGFLRPGEVWHNKTISRDMKVFDKNLQLYPIHANKVLYAAMTGTDAAIYELDKTYLDLKKLGISPFTFLNQHPLLGTKIEITSGYWERGYRCHIDDFIYTLKEGNWTFFDSIRYSPVGCEVIGGTSGSPIVEKDSRIVVGINNTGNQSGRRCKVNNPCEVDEKGRVSVNKGINYGQQTFNFYNCLTIDYRIDLNLSGCNLAK